MGGRRVADDELFVVRQGKRCRAERRSCEFCEAAFLVPISRPIGYGRFCSLTCARSRRVEDRFWSKIAKSDGCWEWNGSRDKSGYGIIGASRYGPAIRAHRVSWELHNGRPVPDGLDVLHHCDNPPCVRPDHLYIGTDVENARDRVVRGRVPSHRGEANPNARLLPDDVRAILTAIAGGETQTSVAKRYGLSQPYVSQIVRGESWRSIPR